jgi:predicted deacylase
MPVPDAPVTVSAPDHRNVPITIGDHTVAPGRIGRFELPFARLPTGGHASLPIAVVNGRYAGPHVWLSAAIHGDELNGVEIVRRVMRSINARNLRGAVVAVPIVNVLGFMGENRYLPDRRDLNRSFPGSKRGSLAARLAHLFVTEIVEHCSVGIDLHTATNHRANLPQVRADLDDPLTLEIATAFAAPFSIHARVRDGSLRQAATELDRTALVYEAGQAHRFDADAVQIGIRGIMRTLDHLDMLRGNVAPPDAEPTRLVRATRWVRARRGGIATLEVDLGEAVEQGAVLGEISDAFGSRASKIRASTSGWVIARTLNPLVGPGDALVHIASHEEGRDEPAERRRRRRR